MNQSQSFGFSRNPESQPQRLDTSTDPALSTTLNDIDTNSSLLQPRNDTPRRPQTTKNNEKPISEVHSSKHTKAKKSPSNKSEYPLSDITEIESISALGGWQYKFRKLLFTAWIIILCLIIAVIVTFIVQNLQNVRISFFTWHGEAPLAVALLIALICGTTFMFVILSWKLWDLRQISRKSVKKRK